MLSEIKHDTNISYLEDIIYCNMDKIEYDDKQNPRQFNCKKITRKKTDFYKYNYDISSKYKNIKETFNISDDVIDNTIKENCCNCINIVLYSTGDLVKLYDYLFHK